MPTPRPWKFLSGSIYGPDSCGDHDDDDTRYRIRIALMDRETPDTSPCERDDNARLAVHCVNTHAALLEALKACEENLRLIHNATGDLPDSAPMPTHSSFGAWKLAQAAIAAAKVTP